MPDSPRKNVPCCVMDNAKPHLVIWTRKLVQDVAGCILFTCGKIAQEDFLEILGGRGASPQEQGLAVFVISAYLASIATSCTSLQITGSILALPGDLLCVWMCWTYLRRPAGLLQHPSHLLQAGC